MAENKTENYGLNLPTDNDVTNIDELNENAQKIDAELKRLNEEKAGKEEIISLVVLASGWNEKKYSFEDVYPSGKCNIEIQPSEYCNYEQYEAWCNAMIVGSSTENIITALGDIPNVDIPIIVKVGCK